MVSKIHILRRTYEGLRAVLSGDPTNVLIANPVFSHPAKLSAASSKPFKTLPDTVLCVFGTFFVRCKELGFGSNNEQGIAAKIWGDG